MGAVINARSSGISAQGPSEYGQAKGMPSSAFKSLFALSEAYSAEGGRELSGAAGHAGRYRGGLKGARRYYNAVAQDYNTRIHSVPSNILAQSFNFAEKDFFEIPEAEKAFPGVDFSGRGDG